MKAFFITPFTAERAGNEEPMVFRRVQEAIAGAVSAAGLTLLHPAQMQSAGFIMDEVRDAVRQADIIIALLTGQNPNVLYELGIALESGSRPPIIVARSEEDVPFDVRHYRSWTYGKPGELENLQSCLQEALRVTLASTPRRGAMASSRQPLLDRKTLARSVGAELNFRSRATPFLGRTAQLEFLHRFVACSSKFRWQSVHGPAGAGKSRLALEFLLALDNAWAAGFLPPGNGFINEWDFWSPERPTFFVIDDVETRREEVRAILQALSLREETLEHQVRVLLIGRERAKHLERLFQLSPVEWETHFQASTFDSPLRLGPLELQDIRDLLMQCAGINLPGGRFNDSVLRLPLYALFMSMALRDGKDALQWDPTALARYVLQRNRSQYWRDITLKDENLLAYLNIVGQLSRPALGQLPHRDLFPENYEEALQHNQIMTGSEDDVLTPLRPAPLAELFVLDLMGQTRDPVEILDRGHQIADGAFRTPIVSNEFAVRAMAHFPSHPALPRLLAAMVPHFDEQLNMTIDLGIPILVDASYELVKEGNSDLASAFVQTMALLQKRKYKGIAGYPEAAFNLASALSTTGAFKEALQVVDELEKQTVASGYDANELGKAYVNVTVSAQEWNNRSVALQLVDRVLALAKTLPSLNQYALGAAVAAIKLATDAKQAYSILDRCIQLLHPNIADKDLATSVAEVACNAANLAQRENAGPIALSIFELTKQAAQTFPLPAALVARCAIPVAIFVTSGDSTKRRSFVETLMRVAEGAPDEDTALNCIMAMYNLLWSLPDLEADLETLEAMCQLASQFSQLSPDYCLAAAHHLSLSHPDETIRFQKMLQDFLPGALDPNYLSTKESQWNLDLSKFRLTGG